MGRLEAAKRTGTLSKGTRALILIDAAVGVGSILWHTLPDSWTFYLDIVPIIVFIMCFIWLYTRRVLGASAGAALLSVAAFLLATAVVIPYAGVLHGALVYTPGLLVVVVLGLAAAKTQVVARSTLLVAAGVYLVALVFRTIDNEVCSAVPIGTHFIWHALIGLVTYLAMYALLVNLASNVAPRVEKRL